MSDVEKCPFCGSVISTLAYAGQPATEWHWECITCHARGPTVPATSAAGGGHIPLDKVLKAWNERIVQ